MQQKTTIEVYMKPLYRRYGRIWAVSLCGSNNCMVIVNILLDDISTISNNLGLTCRLTQGIGNLLRFEQKCNLNYKISKNIVFNLKDLLENKNLCLECNNVFDQFDTWFHSHPQYRQDMP